MLPVKKFLLQCRRDTIELEILRQKQNFLRASLLPKAVQPKDVDVQTSSPGDAMADRMAAVVDLDQDIDAAITRLARDHSIALRVIGAVSSSTNRQILEMYYLDPNCPSWERIARRIPCSERQLYRWHGEALLEAQAEFSKLSENVIRN